MNAKRRTVKTLAVDGTREVIAEGRPVKLHAIIRERDFTHNRVAGFATSLELAVVLAAAPELLEACETALANLAPIYPSNHIVMEQLRAAIAKARAKP
jgi:hypothetical protein